MAALQQISAVRNFLTIADVLRACCYPLRIVCCLWRNRLESIGGCEYRNAYIVHTQHNMMPHDANIKTQPTCSPLPNLERLLIVCVDAQRTEFLRYASRTPIEVIPAGLPTLYSIVTGPHESATGRLDVQIEGFARMRDYYYVAGIAHHMPHNSQSWITQIPVQFYYQLSRT